MSEEHWSATLRETTGELRANGLVSDPIDAAIYTLALRWAWVNDRMNRGLDTAGEICAIATALELLAETHADNVRAAHDFALEWLAKKYPAAVVAYRATTELGFR